MGHQRNEKGVGRFEHRCRQIAARKITKRPDYQVLQDIGLNSKNSTVWRQKQRKVH